MLGPCDTELRALRRPVLWGLGDPLPASSAPLHWPLPVSEAQQIGPCFSPSYSFPAGLACFPGGLTPSPLESELEHQGGFPESPSAVVPIVHALLSSVPPRPPVSSSPSYSASDDLLIVCPLAQLMAAGSSCWSPLSPAQAWSSKNWRRNPEIFKQSTWSTENTHNWAFRFAFSEVRKPFSRNLMN